MRETRKSVQKTLNNNVRTDNDAMLTVSKIDVSLKGLQVVNKLVTAIQKREAIAAGEAAAASPTGEAEQTSEIVKSVVTFQFGKTSSAIKNIKKLFNGELGYDASDPDVQSDPRKAIAREYTKALTKWLDVNQTNVVVTRVGDLFFLNETTAEYVSGKREDFEDVDVETAIDNAPAQASAPDCD
jgi:hypothetical protein